MRLIDIIDKKYLMPIPNNKNNLEGWEKIKITGSNEPLISLRNISDKIIVSPQYFLNNIKGAENDCLMRVSVVQKIIKIADKLPNGFKLLIWDAFRKIETQQSLFDEYYNRVKNEYFNLSEEEQIEITKKFVSLPSKDSSKPSPHNTGATVDLTISDDKGKTINMGTFFDDFEIKSHTRFYEEKLKKGEILNEEEKEILMNRRILCNLFSEEGFANYPYEIWHKSYMDQMCAKILNKSNAKFGGIEN